MQPYLSLNISGIPIYERPWDVHPRGQILALRHRVTVRYDLYVGKIPE